MIQRKTLISILRDARKILGKEFKVLGEVPACCLGCVRLEDKFENNYLISKTWRTGMNKRDDWNEFEKMYFAHSGITLDLANQMYKTVKEKYNLELTWTGKDNDCFMLIEDQKVKKHELF